MKIALTVKGVGFGAWLDADFSNCGHVMVVEDDNQFEAWKNPLRRSYDHSGRELAESIIQAEPDILVTGNIADDQKGLFISQGIGVMDQRQGYVLELLEEARQR